MGVSTQELFKLENILKIPNSTSTPVRIAEATYLYEFIKQKKIERTCEIGLGYGRSAAYIMFATKKRHIGIDPYQKNYQNAALLNIRRAGLKNKFSHIMEKSQIALGDLYKKGKKFQLIFIDGDHKFDGIFTDFFFSDLILEQNGYLIFHDAWMRSTQLVCNFIVTNRCNYILQSSNEKNLIIFKKQGIDCRSGMYFREFYTFQKTCSYHLKEQLEKYPRLKKIIKKYFGRKNN